MNVLGGGGGACDPGAQAVDRPQPGEEAGGVRARAQPTQALSFLLVSSGSISWYHLSLTHTHTDTHKMHGMCTQHVHTSIHRHPLVTDGSGSSGLACAKVKERKRIESRAAGTAYRSLFFTPAHHPPDFRNRCPVTGTPVPEIPGRMGNLAALVFWYQELLGELALLGRNRDLVYHREQWSSRVGNGGLCRPWGQKLAANNQQPCAIYLSINRRCLSPCPPSFNSTSPIVANLPNQAPARTVLCVPCHCWRLAGLVLMFAHIKVA